MTEASKDKNKKRALAAVILLLALGTAVVLMNSGPEPPVAPGNVTATPTPEPTPMMTPTNNTSASGGSPLEAPQDEGPMDVCDPRHNASWLYSHGCYGSGGGGSRSAPPAAPRGVDIEVDGEDPWNAVYSGNLSGMLPYCTRYIEFPVTNIGEETAKIYKRITVTNETGGDPVYAGVASSEPEYTEGGGFTAEGYVEQCNLSDYTIYDLAVTINGDDQIIISPLQEILMSEMNNTWTYLGELPKGQTMLVNQSYHLTGVTSNWAQGDVVVFDIELYAVSLDGGAPQ